MPEEILTVVRLPLADLSEEIRRKHKLSEALVDSRIEGEVLVMYFARTPRASSPKVPVGRAAEVSREVRSAVTGTQDGKRRRRAKGKRR